jgi:hypothetical protein
VFENRRRIFVFKEVEVIVGWRKLHNKSFTKLYEKVRWRIR